MTALLLLLTLALPAPTELPELRTETSRTFDNHDGTYTARIEPSRPHPGDGRDTARCTYSGYLHAYNWRGIWYYSLDEPDINYRHDLGGDDYGLMRFDLSPLPDNARPVRASCHWYQYEVHSQNIATNLLRVRVNPDSATPQEVYNAISNGVIVADQMAHTYVGWVNRELNAAGVAAVESCLVRDTVVLGIVVVGYEHAQAYGMDMQDLSPWLEVTYHPPFGVDLTTASPIPYDILAEDSTCFVAVRISNRGVGLADSFRVDILMDTAASGQVVAGPLQPNEDTTVLVPVVVPPGSEGTHVVQAVSYSPWDYAHENDSSPAVLLCVFPQGTYLTQGFEGSRWPPAGWHVVSGIVPSWHRSAVTQHSGTFSAGGRNVSEPGNDDWLISDTLHPVAGRYDSVAFYISANRLLPAQKLELWALSDTTPSDTLALLWREWYGNPDWSPRRLSLDDFDDSTIRVGFRVQTNQYVLYIDDIHFMACRVPGVQDVPSEWQGPSFGASPNPASRRATVSYTLPMQAAAELSVLDVSGREVWTKRLAGERTGTIQLPLLPAGVYLVRFQSASFTATEKLVVQR